MSEPVRSGKPEKGVLTEIAWYVGNKLWVLGAPLIASFVVVGCTFKLAGGEFSLLTGCF